MYEYYANAKECHAYLEDFDFQWGESVDDIALKWSALCLQLPGSRWFTRGWTLQELIAPSVVIFLSSDWKIFGFKHRGLLQKHGEHDDVDAPRYAEFLDSSTPSEVTSE